jgi:hypothetical protein
MNVEVAAAAVCLVTLRLCIYCRPLFGRSRQLSFYDYQSL